MVNSTGAESLEMIIELLISAYYLHNPIIMELGNQVSTVYVDFGLYQHAPTF